MDRGERPNIEKSPSSERPVGGAEFDNVRAGDWCASNRDALAIPWSAQVVQRMRLESAELVRVDGLVGARVSGTLLGGGRVTAVRNVSVRCEVETVVSDGMPEGADVVHSRKTATETDSSKAGLSAGENLLATTSTSTARPCYRHDFTTASENHDVDVAGAEASACLGKDRLDEIGYTHLNRQSVATRVRSNEGVRKTEGTEQRGEGSEDEDHRRKLEQSVEHSTIPYARAVRAAEQRGLVLGCRTDCGGSGEEDRLCRRTSGGNTWTSKGSENGEIGARDDRLVEPGRTSNFGEYVEMAAAKRTPMEHPVCIRETEPRRGD